MTRTRSLPLAIATVTGGVVLSLMLTFAALAQEPEPGVGLIVHSSDQISYARGGGPGTCRDTVTLDPSHDPYLATGADRRQTGSELPEGERQRFWVIWHNRYGGFSDPTGRQREIKPEYGGAVATEAALPICTAALDGEYWAVAGIRDPHPIDRGRVCLAGQWHPVPTRCKTPGARGADPHSIFAESRLKELFLAPDHIRRRVITGTPATHDGLPTALERHDAAMSKTLWSRVTRAWELLRPDDGGGGDEEGGGGGEGEDTGPAACCKPAGAWECGEIPPAIYERCTTTASRCTVWESTRGAGVCDAACWQEAGGGFVSASHQVIDTPRCRPGGGAEGPGNDEEDDPPPDDEEDDGEDDPPPPPADCECDLTLTNAQIVLLGERLLAAADARAALERAHDLRLDELERTAEELRQAVEELRRDPDPDPPPVECQAPAEREAALEAWALRNRNPGMVAAGWDGERTLQVIRAQPPGNWHRSLLAAFQSTLPPACEDDEGEDQGEDVAEIVWPEIPNHHAETTERYRLHGWVLHGMLPPHVAMSSKRGANTPNQRFLRAVDLYLTSGEPGDLLAELATRHTAFMGAEQGDYRLYHPEAALVATLAAQARDGDEVEAEAKAWLASYCAYADLMSVGGVSRIPGPRIGAAYGRDDWRDETCRILSGAAPPRAGEWEILDSDAARHLAGRLRGQVTWGRADLPGVLSPLTVEVRQRGVVAKVEEYAKAAGGPVWATAADTAGNEVMVSWRDAGATAWKCGRDSPPGCVPANRWGGNRPLKAPVELDTSALNLGPLVEEWVLDTSGAERVR